MSKRLITALEGMLDNFECDIPDRNCSCHVSPPCADCYEWSAKREAVENAREVLKAAREADGASEAAPAAETSTQPATPDAPAAPVPAEDAQLAPVAAAAGALSDSDADRIAAAAENTVGMGAAAWAPQRPLRCGLRRFWRNGGDGATAAPAL